METLQLVKIDPKEFGLEESVAAQIAAQFQPMLDKMVELENEYNEIINLPVEDDETSKKAKQLLQKYVKVRTGTGEIHKVQKAFYLAGGRYVDGWKNAQLFASQGKEEKLEAIAKYAENKEKERIAALQSKRIEAISPYVEEYVLAASGNLGTMSESQFEALFNGYRIAYENKIQAEKKAEEDRIAKEKADAEAREAQRIENERLKKENEEKSAIRKKRNDELRPLIIFIPDYNAMLDLPEQDYQKELAEIKNDAEQYYEQQRKDAEKSKKEKEVFDKEQAKLKAENERIGKELWQKQLREQKEKEEQEKLESAPDKEKIKDLIKRLMEFDFPTVKTKKAISIIAASKVKLIELIDNITQSSSKL